MGYSKRIQLAKTNPLANAPTLDQLTEAMLGRGSTSLVASDGKIRAGNFTLMPVGLHMEQAATVDEWREVGGILRRLDASIQWLIGDWMAYGERVWGQTYEQVAAETGYSYQTLRDYSWVARNVGLSIRIDKLSFSHHRLVASLSPEQQQEWLDYAVMNNLSLSQMRQAIEGKPPALPSSHVYDTLFSSENKPKISRIERLFLKAGRGDRRAHNELLSQIELSRRWLDELEHFARKEL